MRVLQASHVFVLACLTAVLAQGQPAELSIDQNAGPIRIGLEGAPGADYVLEASGNLASTNWDSLLTLSLTNPLQTWFDSSSSLFPQRFYRAVKLDSPAQEFAEDFRLIDHTGRSHSLFYYNSATNVKAFVLIFTGNGCSNVHQLLTTIKALRDAFSPRGVLFWMIDSNQGDNRSNIVAEATALGIDLPILHDWAQLVARTYKATKTPEVVCIGKPQWTVFYRGQIDDRIGSNTVATTQYYVSNALSNFLAGRTVSPRRSQARGCDITLAPPQPNISYSADIAPLLQDKCVRCHSPGNIAPWAMTNYDIVQFYAGSMRSEILAGRMPPWHADPYYGLFENDGSLSPAEASRLVQWIDDGAPRGTGPDPLSNVPPTTNYPHAWPLELGLPTAVYSIPVQSIPATGVIDYRYLNVTTTFSNDVWLSAAVVKPGNLKVVHHVLVMSGSSGTLNGLDGFFAGYVPGYEGGAFPPGTGKLLRRGETLRFQMHYISTGTAQTDQTQIGLYVMPAQPTYSLQTKSAFNVTFQIPPFTNGYQATASFGPFSKPVYVYEFSPHMHLRGSWFKYEVVHTNNTREILCSVPYYVFHWQRLYRMVQPKLLPAGARLVCTGAWDNTYQNNELMEAHAASGDPRFLPDHTVTFDEQTFDEMFIGYFNFAEIP